MQAKIRDQDGGWKREYLYNSACIQDTVIIITDIIYYY